MSGEFSLQSLNRQQRLAVTAPPSDSILVFAGAGSGKTRVLAYRIAWLCDSEGFSPHNVLALTFTNKAAREMRARVEEVLGCSVRGLWIGTFHGICFRLLSQHWEAIGLLKNFQVIDAAEQRRFLRRTMSNLGLDTKQDYVREVQYFINDCKEAGFRAGSVPVDPNERKPHRKLEHLRIYAAYENACRQAGLMDFAELLLRSYEMFAECKDILQSYRERFRCLMVDEFQDVSHMQYAWLRRLAGETMPLFAVGDDDQSIYGWRGASSEIFNRARRDFKPIRTQPLERNYRSTQTILSAAHHVIKNNSERFTKKLWSRKDVGKPLEILSAGNERSEAAFVVSAARKWVESGREYGEIGVLYRSNAQSRVFESALVSQNVPFRVYGGMRFFERAVIKDALAYLCLLCNHSSDHFFTRIINTPPRGIGPQKLSLVYEHAKRHNCSHWQALESLTAGKITAQSKPLAGFRELIMDLDNRIKNQPLTEQIRLVIERSGLLAYHRSDLSEAGRTNVEYLEELVNAAQDAIRYDEVPDDVSPLEFFLAQVTLDSGDAQGAEDKNGLSLMTVHAAKGLEFPLVFLVGMEEDLFPHKRSFNEPGGLEEERRLCYVGMTRAREHLLMSWCENRSIFGTSVFSHRSRFISEIPNELVHEVNSAPHHDRQDVAGRRRSGSGTGEAFNVELPGAAGMAVRHASFGEGTVTGFAGSGQALRVHVRFHDGSGKWFVWAYAGLEMLDPGAN